MLPCVPHLINIAQLGGLGRKEQRGIWRAGEAVFAHESEILSAFPAEPEPGCARRMAGSRRDMPRWPRAPAMLLSLRLLQASPKDGDIGRGWMDGWVASCLGPGSALGEHWEIVNIFLKFKGLLILTPC